MCSAALFLILSWVDLSLFRSSTLTCLRLNLKSVRTSEFLTVTGLKEYGSKSKDRSSKRTLLLRAALALPYQEALAEMMKINKRVSPKDIAMQAEYGQNKIIENRLYLNL